MARRRRSQDTEDKQLKDFGEPCKFDPHFKGPCKKRSCTDIFCLLLFVAFIASWAVIAAYAYKNGDPERLILPTDSLNRKCGVDSSVLNKPYLVFLDLTKCVDLTVPLNGCPTTQVCVSECPKENFLLSLYSESDNFEEIRSKLICDVDTASIRNLAHAKELAQNNQCAEWYLKSEPFLNRCIADVLPKICPNLNLNKRLRGSRKLTFDRNPTNVRDQILKLIDFNLSEMELSECPKKNYGRFNPNFAARSQDSNKKVILQMGQMIIEDVMDSYKYILMGFFVSMVVSLIFIAMMRWIAGPMVWLSILGVMGLLSYGVYYSYQQYAYFKMYPNYNTDAATNIYSIVRKWLNQYETWMWILVILSIVLAILLLVVIFLRKRIVIAIALIKEGSKAVSSTISSVFFPILPWILQVSVIVFAVSVGLYLAAVGDSQFKVIGLPNGEKCMCGGTTYENGDSCVPTDFNAHCAKRSLANLFQRVVTGGSCESASCHFQGVEGPNILVYMHIWNIVGYFWAAFFVAAFGEMVLAATFATWYWTFHKSKVPFFTLTGGAYRTIRYHLGTLAFGSLIVTICRIIRCILEYIDHKLRKFDNPVTRAIMCCMKCFFWLLEKFLKFINRNAYIMVAIHGKSFCPSAKDAFNLLMRNVLRVVALDKVTDFLFFLSKILISVGMGCVTYVYVTHDNREGDLHYNLVPVTLVVLGSYLIATVFFGVYSMAVDTLFMCFLEDCERNDGSVEKPYFMSKSLMKILGKRNDLPRNRYN